MAERWPSKDIEQPKSEDSPSNIVETAPLDSMTFGAHADSQRAGRHHSLPCEPVCHAIHFVGITNALFEWDDGKAAITITDDDSDPDERRFVAIGMGTKGRVLVVVYTYRGDNIRIISARPAEPHERTEYEEKL
jgi:uncharacterized DUF497 family protein